MDLFSVFLMYFYYYGMPVAAIANIILAIFIICTKEKVTKLLGVIAVINGAGSLISSLYQLVIRYLSMESMVRFAGFNSFAAITLGIASGIFLTLYVNKRYGTKIHIGIILIAVSNLIPVIIRVIMGRFLPPGKFDNVEMYSNLMMLLSLIPVLAADILWFVIFIKNRVKEKDLKFLWLMHLNSLIGVSANFMFYLSSLMTAKNAYRIVQNSNSTLLLSVSILGVFFTLGIEIYILIKGSKDRDQTQ